MNRFFQLAPLAPLERRSSSLDVPDEFPSSDDDHTVIEPSVRDPRINAAAPDVFVPHRPSGLRGLFTRNNYNNVPLNPPEHFHEVTPETPSIFGRTPSFSFTPLYHASRDKRRERKERNERRKKERLFRRSKYDVVPLPDDLAAERGQQPLPPDTPWEGIFVESTDAERDRLRFQRKKNRSAESPIGINQIEEDNEYFGARQTDARESERTTRPGEEALLKFIRAALGNKAENFTVRLMNKTPITSNTSFRYELHQGSEQSDLDIIARDLSNGRLYKVGRKLEGGSWCNLLLGDRFTLKGGKRQRHELTYTRESCTCIRCCVRDTQAAREVQSGHNSNDGDSGDSGTAADLISISSVSSRIPVHSAMANFVVKNPLPTTDELAGIGGVSSWRELEIGTIVRLHSRPAAKLKFTEDVRQLFGHHAYTGPLSHEEIYRRVTTIGVNYYQYNKGKKERKVYIQGDLVRLPVQVGVVKLSTQPMYTDDLGATFVLYRPQIVSIYVGEIVLEGNSIGSFIKTGIRYYIGFGEERGACAVFPNKTLGPQRKLGINELLLHHHMVSDLTVHML